MLLNVESANLAIRGIPPQLKAAVASIGLNRPIILARATYATYPVNSASAVILQYRFDAYSLVAGAQLVLRLFGTVSNAGVSPQLFQPIVRVTQKSGAQVLGANTQTVNTTTAVAWMLDATISISLPLATGQYARTAGDQAVVGNGLYTTGNQPNAAITVGGVMTTTISSNSYTGGNVAGGAPVSTASSGSFQIATINPNALTLDNSVPSLFTLEMSSGPNVTFTVQGGYLLGL